MSTRVLSQLEQLKSLVIDSVVEQFFDDLMEAYRAQTKNVNFENLNAFLKKVEKSRRSTDISEITNTTSNINSDESDIDPLA